MPALALHDAAKPSARVVETEDRIKRCIVFINGVLGQTLVFELVKCVSMISKWDEEA